MFISITHRDTPELSTVLRRSSSDIDMSMEKVLLVNPDCPVRIMLEYIRRKCKLGIYTQFDICDENGGLKGLFNMPTYAYATDLFEHKKTYYIIVLKMEGEKRMSVLPQLNHENRIYPELKAKVKHYLINGDLSPQPPTPQSTPLLGKATPTSLGKQSKKK